MVRYWLSIALLLSASSLHAQEGNTGFYLLRTGNVLEGTATLDGRHYLVQTQFGSMSIPVQSVEFVGKSRADIYHHRQSGVDATDYNALVRLAEWCVSNGFIDEGIAEYNRASQVVPNAVFAGIVQQRLDTLRQVTMTDSTPELPVLQTEPSSSPVISRQVFESFVRRVQPVLVNRCIAADCHGTHSERQFKLGTPQESMGSTSRRNVQAVLPYIDREDPMASPLLSALATPHGGTKMALTVDSHSYIQIAQWVQQVAKELPLKQRAEGVAMPPRVSILPEPSGTARASDPLDPNVFNERYHRQTRSTVPRP